MTLEYPFGRPLVPAMPIRRLRPLPPGATPLVGLDTRVQEDQPIAEIIGPAGQRAVVLAGLSGRVVEVASPWGITIEGVAAALFGVVGLGGPVVGPVAMLPRGESLAVVPIPRGAVILYPRQLSLTLLQRAAAGGAVGIVAASASARELEAFARADLSAILDGLAVGMPQTPLTVMLTEGLGAQSMSPHTYQFLAQHIGNPVLLTGTTDPRRGVRPEVLLAPAPDMPAAGTTLDGALSVGARVAVALGPRRGTQGQITHLFARKQFAGTDVLAAAAAIRFDDGTIDVVPLHALDRIG